MLRTLEFEVTEASNGREAWDRLVQLGVPDLVTVNWNMPVMDGIEFMQAVRADARYRTLPLVMISVESKPAQVMRAMQAGASAYVVKPFTMDQLVDKLNHIGLSVGGGKNPANGNRQTPPMRVLIVDDSVVIRHTLSAVLAEDEQLEVAGTAADGRIALDKVRQVVPDVVLLDVEMPNMNGFETLKALRSTHPKLPVIMFSSLTERGAAATLDALMLGANDYVPKPANVHDMAAAKACIRDELIPKIKQFRPRPHGGAANLGRAAVTPPARTVRRRVEIVVIGASTGGPAALSRLLPAFAVDCPVPVVIVQHMPPVFTRHLANRLAASGQLSVCEATDRVAVGPQTVWICAGRLSRDAGQVRGFIGIAFESRPAGKFVSTIG